MTLVTVGGFAGFMGISSIVGYSLFLFPQILSFWMMNTSAIAEITDSFWDFNNMPMEIYSTWIKITGVFIIPDLYDHQLPAPVCAGQAAPRLLGLVADRPHPGADRRPFILETRPAQLQQRQQLEVSETHPQACLWVGFAKSALQ